MHPDQFTLINSQDTAIFKRSVSELSYHAGVLDALGLDDTAKIQIHLGGVYGDRKASIDRFAERFETLDEALKKRLVVENDDTRFTLADCLEVSRRTGLPVVFDVLHHAILNSGETVPEACSARLKRGSSRWIADCRLQSAEARGPQGKHAESLEANAFEAFLEQTRPIDFDLMPRSKTRNKAPSGPYRLLQLTPGS